jgi:hypothetical protein
MCYLKWRKAETKTAVIDCRTNYVGGGLCGERSAVEENQFLHVTNTILEARSRMSVAWVTGQMRALSRLTSNSSAMLALKLTALSMPFLPGTTIRGCDVQNVAAGKSLCLKRESETTWPPAADPV